MFWFKTDFESLREINKLKNKHWMSWVNVRYMCEEKTWTFYTYHWEWSLERLWNNISATCMSWLHIIYYSNQYTYPTVSSIVHISLHLPGVGHQIVHPPVLQSRWIRGREYSLYSAKSTNKFIKLDLDKTSCHNHYNSKGNNFKFCSNLFIGCLWNTQMPRISVQVPDVKLTLIFYMYNKFTLINGHIYFFSNLSIKFQRARNNTTAFYCPF